MYKTFVVAVIVILKDFEIYLYVYYNVARRVLIFKFYQIYLIKKINDKKANDTGF